MHRVLVIIGAALLPAGTVYAQGGPPFLTNDPGTPGNGNWEINIAALHTAEPSATYYQLPQIDLNLGLGERIQLTYQIPYVIQSVAGQPQQTGWSNSIVGVKWRFLEQGEKGWQVSTFPQVQTAGSARAQRIGIAEDGPRLLIPLEVSKQLGNFNVNFEAGYTFAHNGTDERILGILIGRQVRRRLELGVELYSDRSAGGSPDETTVDLGARYELSPACTLLFMAGRSVSGDSEGHAQFIGYFGLQILLSNFGRTLMQDTGR